MKQETKVKCYVCGELRDCNKIATYTVDITKAKGGTRPEAKHINYCMDKGKCINGILSIGNK